MPEGGALTLRELVAKLGFKVDDSAFDKFEKRLGGIKRGLEYVFGAEGILTAGLFELAKKTAETGEEIGHTSEILGLTAEQYQKLRYAADLAGQSHEEFAIAVRFLNRNVGDAIRGTGAARDAFLKLGVSVERGGHGRPTAEVIHDLADAFQRVKDPALRASYAQDIFGRGGIRMGTILAHGSKYLEQTGMDLEAFGLFNEEAVKQSEEFVVSWKKLLTVFGGVRNELGIGLLPTIRGLLEKFRLWILQNRELIKQKLVQFIHLVGVGAKVLLWTITHLIPIMKALTIAVIALGGAFAIVQILPWIRAFGLFPTIALGFSNAIGLITKGFAALDLALLPEIIFFGLLAVAIAEVILWGEDLYTWFQGGESITGEYLGNFQDFKDEWLDDWDQIKEYFKALGEFFTGIWDVIFGGFTLNVEQMKKGLDELGIASKAHGGVSGGGGNQGYFNPASVYGFGGAGGASFERPTAGASVHNEVHVTVPVPPGTPTSHVDAIGSHVQKIVDQTLKRHISHVVENNPRLRR